MMAMLGKLILFYGGGLLILVIWSGFFVFLFIALKLIKHYAPAADFNFTKLRRVFFKSVIYILTLPFFAWMLLYISAIPIVYTRYKMCVEFPNGVLLGHTSFLDRETISYILDPYPTKIFLSLKLSDGTILTRDNIVELHFSETTIYGVLDRAYSRGFGENAPYRFGYRSDVGFILARDEPDLYRELEEEAGELIPLPEPGEYSTRPPWEKYMNEYIAKIYYVLRGDATYRREGCPLNIFP